MPRASTWLLERPLILGIRNNTLPKLPDVVINPGAGGLAAQQATVAAENALIPVVYGRQRVGGKIFAVAQLGTDLVIGAVWCVGEIEAIESVTINDEAVAGTVTVTSYTGTTTQAVDSTLASAIPGYADTLRQTVDGVAIGVAYSVFRIPPAAVSGFPRVEAIIQGRKVYDPRTTLTGYSRNPALALADWLANVPFGHGVSVDWTAVGTAADACDDALSDASKRRELDLVIDSVLPVAQWADLLRTYAGCFMAWDGSAIKLVPDRPRASDRALTLASLVGGSLRLSRLPIRERPTVVRVTYTDTSSVPWRDANVAAEASGVSAGTLARREDEVSLPGITRRAQAYREAVERLNVATLTDLRAEWLTFDDGLVDMIGDVVTLTHAGVGLSTQPFRIVDVQLDGPGRWRVSAVEYDAAVYSDLIAAPSGGSYSDMPDPSIIPTLTGLTCASGSAHLLTLLDGTILSRLHVSWTASSYLYTDRVELEFKRTGDTLWQRAPVDVTSGYCAPVQDGATYDVRVRLVNGLGQAGEWATDTHVVVGKTEPPPDCDAFGLTTYGDGTRNFTWTLATPPVDLAGFEIRYVSGASGTWASMAALHTGLLLASPFETNQLAAGTWTFAIKAVDTSGNESANAKYITATLPDPRLANIIDIYQAGPTWAGTKTACWVDAITGWLVATDSKTWASFPTDGVTWATWTSWARDANDMTYQHTTLDLGTITTFTPLVTAQCPAGTAAIQEQVSDDNVTWSSWATAASAPLSGRYYRAKVTVSGSAGDDLRLEGFQIILTAEPLEEVIEDLATSGLTGSYRIGTGDIRLPISEDFATIRSVFVTLQNTGAGWSWELIDKDTTTGPRIKIYNASNAAADATIDALIRGL